MTGIDFRDYFRDADGTPLARFSDTLANAIAQTFEQRRHGDFDRWRDVLTALPHSQPSDTRLDRDIVSIGAASDLDRSDADALPTLLRQLKPWRKGPFELFGCTVDAEWQSYLKWNRLAPGLAPLAGRLVLDVGCNNGYYAFRMRGAGARLVLGCDPNQLALMQFRAIKRYLAAEPVHVLPLRDEALPPFQVFDTVFSMGVLHHQKHPIGHLERLRAFLRPGGQLILEALIVDRAEDRVLVPPERYAQMGNVWFLPSPRALENWLGRVGFENITTIDVARTTTDEQRATEWMDFRSLADFLDPADPARTVEGLPAPTRAIVLATA